MIDPDLFARWSAFSEKQRQEALTSGSEFLAALLKRNLGCPTGDHTRIACTELQDAYPNHPKFGNIGEKGIKGFLCAGNEEDLQALRVMGTVDNWKREQHRSMQFSSRLWQMHNADIQMRVRAVNEKLTQQQERTMRAESNKAFQAAFD
ncbi:MAG: hypothetical protein ACK56I_27195, partial [bacterium]